MQRKSRLRTKNPVYHTCSPVYGESHCSSSALPRGLFPSVRKVKEFILPLVSLLGCVPPLEVLFSLSMLFLCRCSLCATCSDYKTPTPLRADGEQQLFQYGLLRTELQLCTLYLSLLVTFPPGSAKVWYEYLITNFHTCSPKEKAVLCRLVLLGKHNGTVCLCVFCLPI